MASKILLNIFRSEVFSILLHGLSIALMLNSKKQKRNRHLKERVRSNSLFPNTVLTSSQTSRFNHENQSFLYMTSFSLASCNSFNPMFCPPSALWISLRSTCMDSTVWQKSVRGPFMRMRSPTERGKVNSTIATLIFEKK